MLTKLILIAVFIALLLGLYSAWALRAADKAKSDNYYFNFFKTRVYYVPMGNSFELGKQALQGMDIKSIEVLGSNYIKDKSAVYFKDIKIQGADAASFDLLGTGKDSYAKDKYRVYYESNSFKNLDINSFKFEGAVCGPVLKDKNRVYSIYTIKYSTTGNAVIMPIENTSAEKYRVLNEFYGKDDKAVYYKGRPIAEADTKTFILLNEYAKDTNRVYYDGLEVNGIDAASFVFINGGAYTKDKKAVYFGLDIVNDADGHPLYYTGRQLAGADPETFVMIKGEKTDYAKDKKNYYWGGKMQ